MYIKSKAFKSNWLFISKKSVKTKKKFKQNSTNSAECAEIKWTLKSNEIINFNLISKPQSTQKNIASPFYWSKCLWKFLNQIIVGKQFSFCQSKYRTIHVSYLNPSNSLLSVSIGLCILKNVFFSTIY